MRGSCYDMTLTLIVMLTLLLTTSMHQWQVAFLCKLRVRQRLFDY
jgi:hypothetical protein